MTEIHRRLRWVKRPGKRAQAPAKSQRSEDRRLTPTLIVMVRAPGVGRGKQRLARELGQAEAWRIQRRLQTQTMKLAHDRRWRTLLCVTPDSAVRARLDVWPGTIPRIAQGGGDLGARMARALKRRRMVAVIGADCPEISRAHVAAAFAALRTRPFAVGPCPDGGFWILAARNGRTAARAMKDVRWSSVHTLDDVLGRLPALPAQLPTLRDVDTAEDWRALHSGVLQ